MDKIHLDRTSKLVHVFDTTVNAVVVDSTMGMRDCFLNLEKLLISELKTWWDHNSLKMYIEKQMIPRGLRLKKIPTTSYSDAFITKWNDILSSCSLSLMDLIVTEEITKLQSLHAEIEKTQTNLNVYTDTEDFSSLQEKMTNNIAKLESTIMNLKKSKFQRDLEDYNKNQVYNWSKERRMSTPKSILTNRRYRKRRNASHVSFNSTELDAPDTTQSDTEKSRSAKPNTRSASKTNDPETDDENNFLGARGKTKEPDEGITTKKKATGKKRA